MDAKSYLSALSEQTFFRDESVQGSLRWYIAWYAKRAPNRWRLFRVVGVLAMVLSISLPFALSLLPDESRVTAATSVAWAIALLTGLNSFFGWDRSWASYIEAQLKLQALLNLWEVRSAILSNASDAESFKALDELARATVSEASEIISNETRSYFSNVSFPQLSTGRPRHESQ